MDENITQNRNYTYITDVQRLARVIKILGSHYQEAKDFYFSPIKLQITDLDAEIEKLTSLFVAANRQRLGFNEQSLGEATHAFSTNFKRKLEEIKGKKPSEAHFDFLLWLCDIPHTGQKTANLFLMWVVMFAKELKLESLDWVSWAKYLHVPLDRWIVRILWKNLGVATPLFENHFFPQGTVPGIDIQRNHKYRRLQVELDEVASSVNQPKIILDELWLVGHVFDIYRPFLCNHCWIKDECRLVRELGYEIKKHCI